MTTSSGGPAAVTRAGRAHPCPACGSTSVAQIGYGYPALSDELRQDLDAGEVQLGGCMVWPDMPDLQCNACEMQYRIDGRTPSLGELPDEDGAPDQP